MGDAIDFRLLGPVRALRAGATVPVGGLRRRAVLAMLVLDANRIVSTGRLIEGVWGQDPPTTVGTALQGHVSQLRRELGKDVIVTRPPGYMIVTDPEAVDVVRCERSLEQARRELAAGHPATAVERLEVALSEWSGPPLADVAAAPFATEALPVLDELRVAMHEERFEAQLAVNREAEAVTGLRALVVEHPLRERPRAQLMLALHRSGRRAEALAVYDEGRRALAEELGVFPGERLQRLHQDILEQEPALGGAREPSGLKPPPSAPRRGLAHVWIAGALAIAAAALVLVGDDDPRALPPPGAGSVLRIDPETLKVTQQLEVAGSPTSVAAADGRVWFVDADRQTITELQTGGKNRTFATGTSPTDVSFRGRSLWVTGGAAGRSQFQGPMTTTLTEVTAATGAVRANVRLPRAGGAVSSVQDDRVAVSAHAVWAIGRDGALIRVDPLSRAVVRVIRLQAAAIAASADRLWVLTTARAVVPVDERGTRVGTPVDLGATEATSMTVGGGAVWLSDPGDGTLIRIDDTTGALQRIRVGAGIGAVAYGHGAVWVLQPGRDRVLSVDPATRRVSGDVPLGGTPRDIAVSADGVWVSRAGETTSIAAGCGALRRPPGSRPDVVVVADLPLRGDPSAPPSAMAAALEAQIRRRGFSGGRFTVGLRICDDSTSQSGSSDPAKCRVNARAYAAARSIVAEIGPYTSQCASEQLRIAAHAPGGPLAVVSPTNTDPLLTRGVRARDRGAYGRLVAPDDRQAAAMAQLLGRRRATRVYVLDDRQGYGLNVAGVFAAAAEAAGLRVVGRASWTGSTSLARLAERVERSGANAAWVGGLLDTGAGGVVRALRKRGLTVAGPEGLLPVSQLFRDAGDAAHGTLITTGFMPVATLPRAGRLLAAELARVRDAPSVDPTSVYAAQAMDVVLDAIGRSDGTRSSVGEALGSTALKSGLVGPIRFDDAGDLENAPVAIVRADHRVESRPLVATRGAEVVAVVRPRR